MLPQQLLGFTFLPICLTSLFCNGAVFYGTCRLRSSSPSFALLTGSLALFDFCFSLVYFGYAGPMIILDSQFLKDHSKWCGFFIMVFYDAAINIHPVISLNRFFAVFTPLLYSRVYNFSMTRIYAIICFSLSLTMLSVYYSFGCQAYYDDDLWMFYLKTDNPFCVTYSWITDYAKDLVTAYFNVFFDIVTILKVHSIKKQIADASSSRVTRRKEMDFLKQTCVQGFVSLFILTTYNFVPEYITNIYLSFMLTTVLWPILSMTDGVAALVYNSEIRGAVFGRKAKKRALSVSINEMKNSGKI